MHAKFVGLFLCTFFWLSNAYAAEQVVDLNIGYKTVDFAGKSVEALAINNQIPGPTLHFKEGDDVTINVHNHLQEGTTIHWHGILLPWNMDGVEGVSQEAIPPGGIFAYKFKLKQSGTYWYHAHAGFQEQQGIYGGFIIDPPESPPYQYTKDYVVVLSDWSNTAPDQIFANLKKDGDYYTPDFPLQPSLARFIGDYNKASPKERQKLIDDYEMMQDMRMSIYDISDVAYDAFLLNGHPKTNPWTANVQVGDTVRLRFIGAGGSTIFRVKIPGTSMEVVHIQGHDVDPYSVEEFTIAPGETTDVLVKIEEDCPYIIYAESSDSLGAAYGALITNPQQQVDYQKVEPFPTPQPVMMGHGTKGHGGMDHGFSEMDMKSPDHKMDMSSEHASMNMESRSSQNMKDSKPRNHSMDTDSSIHSIEMGSAAIPTKASSETRQSMDMGPNSSPSKMDMKSPDHKMDMSSEHASMNMESSSSSAKMDMGPSTESMDSMSMNSMSHGEKKDSRTKGTKYQNLKSPVKTNDPDKPFQEIKVELSGFMNRFMWFINGLPEYEAEPILIEPGKRYRLIFTNTSMMHHPMHIHGHFFILRNGNGEYDPFLHTIEVPPGATVVADFDADVSGQWFFHCHHLYHMMAGMARAFQYSTIMEDYKKVQAENPCPQCPGHVPEFVKHPVGHHAHFGQASLIDMGYDPYHNAQKGNLNILMGWDKHKLQLYSEDAEIRKGKVESADLDVFYWHLLSEFWAIKGGANYFYKPSHRPYWQPGVGIEGLFPYFIYTNFRTYLHEESIKFDLQLSRDTQLAHNIYLRTGLRGVAATQSVKKDQIGRGLNYIEYIVRPYITIRPGVALYTELNFTQDYGNLKKILHKKGESTNETLILLGISLLF